MSRSTFATTPAPTARWGHPPRGLSSSHRTYRDPEALHSTGVAVACALVDDNTLVSLAEVADRVEFRGSAPSTQATPAAAKLLLDALRALSWVRSTTDPRQMRQRLWRQITDQRARLRIRWSQDMLAGSASLPTAEGNQQVLLLVLARHDIRSCDWHLAA
jgi:hypothetical protein